MLTRPLRATGHRVERHDDEVEDDDEQQPRHDPLGLAVTTASSRLRSAKTRRILADVSSPWRREVRVTPRA